MRRFVYAGILVGMACAAGFFFRSRQVESAMPLLAFEEPEYNLGSFVEGDAVKGDLVVKSFADHVLPVKVHSSCGCLRLTDVGSLAKPGAEIPQHGTLRISYEASTHSYSGQQGSQLTITTPESEVPFITQVTWTVIPTTKAFPAIVSLGELRVSATGEQKITLMQPASMPQFDVARIELSDPDRLSVDVLAVTESKRTDDSGLERRLGILIRYTAPAGVTRTQSLSEQVTLHPKSTQLRPIAIPVRGILVPDIEFMPSKAVVIGAGEQPFRVSYQLAEPLRTVPIELVETPADVQVRLRPEENRIELLCTVPPEGPPVNYAVKFRLGQQIIVYPVVLANRDWGSKQ